MFEPEHSSPAEIERREGGYNIELASYEASRYPVSIKASLAVCVYTRQPGKYSLAREVVSDLVWCQTKHIQRILL